MGIAERRMIEQVVAPVASGVMLFVGTGLEPVWWLVGVAPAPVLWLAPRVSARVAALAAFAAWLAGTANMVAYYRGAYAVPWPVIAVASVLPSAVFAGVTL